MRSLAEYIIDRNENVTGREDIEWCNFWYDSSNVILPSKRVLLVGDSTARMVRSTLAKVLNCPVDLFASSSSIDDVLFINQIDAFFDQSSYNYDVIFVQIGHHGRINRNGEIYEEKDYIKFKNDYVSLLYYLSSFCKIIITESIFDSIKIYKGYFKFAGFVSKYAPKCLKILWKRHEEFDDNINVITRRKNKIIKDLSQSLDNVVFLDINKEIGKTHYIHVDHIHFEESAKYVIAEYMKKTFEKMI